MPTVQETIQEKFWKGAFGTAYTERNNPNWKKRNSFFLDMLYLAKSPQSILEVGCNKGANLRCIRAINPMLNAWGCEINQEAFDEASASGFSVKRRSLFNLYDPKDPDAFKSQFDLVFSVGVLIHVSPTDLERAMRSIIGASKKYVLAVEYADEKEVEVSYRGHAERLWRRPFGDLYAELGLTLVYEGPAPAEAFDRCHAWLLKKC